MNLANDNRAIDFFSDMSEDIPAAIDGPISRKANRFEKRTPTDRAETLYSEPCSKCRGTGFIGAYAFRENGRCYQCDGKGVLTFKTPKAQRDANNEKARDRKERKAAEAFAAFEEANPLIATWWKGSTFPFAVSLREAVLKYGSLTDGQFNAAMKCVEKFRSAVEAKANRDAAAPTVDLTGVERAFAKAKASGLRKVTLRLLGNDIGLVFQPASEYARESNRGAIYVKTEAGLYVGKIQDGKFFKSRECNAELEAGVLDACAKPEEAAVAYGKRFGTCSCCGRQLTNALSIKLGIGPICRGKFFG